MEWWPPPGEEDDMKLIPDILHGVSGLTLPRCDLESIGLGGMKFFKDLRGRQHAGTRPR